mmetsp:Transcript_3482/g.10785  ORF Transcript_3482/g.10785 Transcript_3482/m.10785 type:complete len:284 (+) Transcript_3482:190-1041(+)
MADAPRYYIMVLGETAEVKRELIQTATNGGPSLVGGPHNHINYTMRPVMSRGRRVEVVIYWAAYHGVRRTVTRAKDFKHADIAMVLFDSTSKRSRDRVTPLMSKATKNGKPWVVTAAVEKERDAAGGANDLVDAAIGDSSGKDNVLRCNTADDNSVTAVVQALMDQLMYQLLPPTWTLKVHRTMKASAQAWVANIMMCNRRLARQAFGPMDDVPATADTESRRSGLCIPRRAGALAIMFGKRSRGSRQAARSAAGPPPEPLPLEMWFLILSNLTHADMVKCKR